MTPAAERFCCAPNFLAFDSGWIADREQDRKTQIGSPDGLLRLLRAVQALAYPAGGGIEKALFRGGDQFE